MNLTEFIRQNDIKCADSSDFEHSPVFFKMRQFEQTCHVVRGVPFVEPETYAVKEFDVVLKGLVQEKWDRTERKTRRQYFVDRTFHYPGLSEELESIEDAVPAGKSIDEAMASLEADRERFEFFQRYDLIDGGRYWLNRELKRCFVEDGRVVVMTPGVVDVTEDSWGLPGSDRQLASLLLDQWRREIERAIAQVKRPVNRTGIDSWFRRRWYIAEARRRKTDRRLAKPWANR